MAEVTPTRDVLVDGRWFQAGVTYSLADEFAERVNAELTPEPVAVEEEAPVMERPNTHSLKAEWVAYAVSQGMTEAAAEDMTKDELIDEFSN